MKIAALKSWAIPAFTYILSDVEVCDTFLREKDVVIRRFLRDWTGSSSTSNALFELPEKFGGFGIPSLVKVREKRRFAHLARFLCGPDEEMLPTLSNYFEIARAMFYFSLNQEGSDLYNPRRTPSPRSSPRWLENFLLHTNGLFFPRMILGLLNFKNFLLTDSVQREPGLGTRSEPISASSMIFVSSSKYFLQRRLLCFAMGAALLVLLGTITVAQLAPSSEKVK